MRLVVDTNVMVSAILWEGTPGRLIDLASDRAFTRGLRGLSRNVRADPRVDFGAA